MTDHKEVAQAIRTLADSITPLNAAAYEDEFGKCVLSLTEAMISISDALRFIGEQVGRLADAAHNIANES